MRPHSTAITAADTPVTPSRSEATEGPRDMRQLSDKTVSPEGTSHSSPPDSRLDGRGEVIWTSTLSELSLTQIPQRNDDRSPSSAD